MIRLLVGCPDSSDATSFYRSMGPMRRMGIDYRGQFQIRDSKDFSWDVAGQADVVLFQRPYSAEHLTAAKIVKDMGVKVIMDYDDLLFGLKADNQRPWQKYRSPAIVEALKEMPKFADQIWCATEELATFYKGACADIRVIPNAYDRPLYTYRKSEAPPREKVVLWRGSDSHLHDCLELEPAWTDLIMANPDWTFVFMNAYPWWLCGDPAGPLPKNVRFEGGRGILDYMRTLHHLRPAVMVHPLSKCLFNECKSMCSWLEATHAGAAFIGPDFKEFRRPGITTYEPGDAKSFQEKITYLMKAENIRAKRVQESWTAATGELELGSVNRLRFEALQALL